MINKPAMALPITPCNPKPIPTPTTPMPATKGAIARHPGFHGLSTRIPAGAFTVVLILPSAVFS